MKGFRLTFAIALLIIGLSWSSWLAFSTGFKASELSLELLGDVFEVFKAPLLAGNDSIVDSPRFSVLPLSLDGIGRPQEPDLGTATSSGTAGNNFHPFKEVYVVSLSRRSDRRIAMERIRQVIPRLNWTYVDATNAEDPIISHILDRARAQSSRESEQFSWPDDLLPPAQGPLGHTGGDLWSAPSLGPPGPSLSDANADLRPAREPLTCAQQNSTRGPVYSTAVPPYLVLTRSKLACWHSHATVLRRIAEGGPEDAADEGPGSRDSEVALVLEDDVDIERDLFKRLGEVWGYLPPAWDMLYLGHCWSNETYHGAVTPRGSTTSLHPSFAPKCTHAYAVTRAGARKLVGHLRYEPFAYSRALDQAYAWLVSSGRVKSFSVVPSVVVQRKVSWSDIDKGTDGTGSNWREALTNGVF